MRYHGFASFSALVETLLQTQAERPGTTFFAGHVYPHARLNYFARVSKLVTPLCQTQ